MQNKHLVKAIIDVAVFLEFSGEGVLDPDASIEAMEQLVEELRCMPEHDKNEVAECIRGWANDYAERADFVNDLPENLGLE
ncbi:hypothetical protein [Burkholderia diffusa]|uniref:hypothetical protein n=1 Tax=Burkholderia diffusa TaxID=488732 RepID=UPI0012458C6A|nr:hypothetical protein [Burkholderia diffusa]KAB0657123.1 hypothetical protein F7R23_12020 [Burkholderia diffusa]MBM2655028.1 hypothetical protein [Burkholderia diffusa]